MKMLRLVIAAYLAAPSIAYAKGTLYGEFKYSLGELDAGPVAASNGSLQTNDNGSTIGFKGNKKTKKYDFRYHFEAGAQNDADNFALASRFFFAGLGNSEVGSLDFGRMPTKYRDTGKEVDPFFDTAAGTGVTEANFGLSPLSSGFTSNSIAYESPAIKENFKVNAAAVLSESPTLRDAFGFGVSYEKDDLKVGGQALALNEASAVTGSAADDSKAYRLYGSYKMDLWKFSASWETMETTAAQNEVYVYLAGTYQLEPDLKLAVSYGDAAQTGSVATSGIGYTVGAFYDVMPNTSAHLVYSSVSFDDTTKANNIAIGISHWFGFRTK